MAAGVMTPTVVTATMMATAMSATVPAAATSIELIGRESEHHRERQSYAKQSLHGNSFKCRPKLKMCVDWPALAAPRRG